MEDKDPKDEELNPQGQDDINDADDSFGLPDLDYQPLDKESEEEPSINEEEQTEESVSEDTPTETSYAEEQPVDENEEEGGSEPNETSELRYQIEEEKSNAPKIILGIVGVLLVAAAIWFFGFYRPQQQKLEREALARQEQLDKQKAEEAAALKRRQEEEAAAAAEEQRLRDEAEARAKAGVVAISERTGRYYIVLESFVDADFAKDYGDRVAKAGTPSFLIPPYAKKKMQRVAIGGYDSMDEAQSALNDLSEEFGKDKWILKY